MSKKSFLAVTLFCGAFGLLPVAPVTRAADPPPPIYVAPTPPAAKPKEAAPQQTFTPAPPSPAPPPAASAARSSADLEKLVEPIALHPDSLIALMLPAAAYPLEIVQAARFVRDTNNIAKIDQQPWDENVKQVAKIPQLLSQMDKDIGWTATLGQAFVEQPKELMDTIQALRAKAHQAGTLQSSAQQVVTVTNMVVMTTNVTQVVTVTNQIIQVQPSSSQVVYVPSYPPSVYYPPPGYVYDPYAPLVTFGVGIAVGAIIANNCDWHGGGVWWGGGYHGDVDIDIDNDINIDRGDRPDRPDRGQSGNRASNTGARPTQQKWQPDQQRLRSNGSSATAQNREARGWGSASTQPAARSAMSGNRAAQSPGGARPSTQPSFSGQRGGTGARPSYSQSASRPASANRSSSSSSFSRPSSGSSAFGGMGSGGGARSYSSRGAASRGGGGMRGGRGR